MTVELLTCICGKSLRVETDDKAFLEQEKAKYLKEHKGCKK
jgi:hypothetical protein